MRPLRKSTIVLGSLAISMVAGYFLYTTIEGIRLDLYCKELREGFDCYQEAWEAFPVWLFSLLGGFVAGLAVTLASIFCPVTRVQNSKMTLAVGSVLALPLTLMVGGPIVFLATVLSGLAALLVVLCLTKHSSKDTLKGTA